VKKKLVDLLFQKILSFTKFLAYYC